MKTISAVIIAKNEETVIENALSSISFCDEIIVVDNGSADRTIAIAKKNKAIVVHSETTDFSELRNEGFRHAKGEWILYVDADERVTTELAEEIKIVLKDENAKAAYRIRRKNYYFSKYQWPKIETLERLFNRDALKKWYGSLHESAIVEGEIGELHAFLIHYTHRNLSGMLDKTLSWSTIEANLRFASNHPPVVWWRFPRVMLTAFLDSYISQKSWKVGTPGLIESMYQAFSAFVTYAKLWEMQQEIKNQKEKEKK